MTTLIKSSNIAPGTITAADIEASGVTAASYGSASQVPVITVNTQGLITAATTTSVAGVSSFSWDSSTETLNISTADGGSFNADISGMASESYVDTAIDNLIDSAPGTLDTLNEIATAIQNNDTDIATILSTQATKVDKINITGATVGSASAVPVITFNAQGQITSATTTAVAGVSSTSFSGGVLTINTSDGSSYTTDFDTRYFTETEANANFLGINAKAADSDTLDGLNGTYYLDYTNFTNVPTNVSDFTNDAGYISSADGGNAATLDTLDSTQFLRSDTSDTFTGTLTVSGSISVTGTVAGRDVATDGTKLDGIESGATADQNASEVPYDNSSSGLASTNVQDAIDEVGVTTDPPVLSAPTSGAEASTITVTITNYGDYTDLESIDPVTIAVSAGSFTRSGANISWTLPSVSSTSNHTISVQVDEIGKLISPTTSATVSVVNLESDTNILFENSTISYSNFETTVDTHDIFGDGTTRNTYQLNGNSNDLGGNYNGTDTNVSYTTGLFGQCASFSGNGNIEFTPWSSGTTWTASAWVKGSSLNGIVVGGNGGSGSNNSNAIYISSSGTIIYTKQGNDVFSTTRIPSGLLQDNNWHHVVTVKYASGNNIVTYIDGQSYYPEAYSGAMNDASDVRWIGKRGDNGGTLVGLVDQVRLINRAVSQDEVNKLYAEGTVYLRDNIVDAIVNDASVTSNVVSQDVGDGDFYNPTATLDSLPKKYRIRSTIPDDNAAAKNTHDILGDGSAIASYTLNGTLAALGGSFGTPSGSSITYSTGRIHSQCVHLTQSNNSRIDFDGLAAETTGKTYSIWFKTTNTGWDTLFYFYGGSFGNFDVGNYGLQVGWTSLFGWYTRNNSYDVTGPDVRDGQWHNCMVYVPVGHNDIKIYLDGIMLFSGITADVTLNHLRLGYTIGDPTEADIEQLRVFNRELSQTEINQILHETKPSSNQEVGLLPGGEISSSDTLLVNDGNTTPTEISGSNLDSTFATHNTHDIFGDSSAVATWRLNGDPTDLGGNYDGVPYYMEWEAGRKDLAGKFNGTNARVHFPDPSVSYPFAVSAWVKPNEIEDNDVVVQVGVSGQRMTICMSSYWVENAICAMFGSNGHWTGPKNSIKTNEWNHCVWILNGSDNPQFYVNGRRQVRYNNGGGHGGSVGFAIGNNGNNAEYVNGAIQQVRLFNRAVSEAEIQKLYFEGQYILDVSGLSLTNTPTVVTQDIPTLSQSLVATGAADSFSTAVETSKTFSGNNFTDGDGTTVLDILEDGSCFAAYTLDSDGSDLSGNYNGSVTGVNFGASGQFGNCGTFTGTSTYINLGNSDDFNYYVGQPRSTSFWIYFNDTNASKAILSKDGPSRNWHVGMFNNTQIRWFIKQPDQNQMDRNFHVTTGQWYHIVLVWGGTLRDESMTVYMNGIRKDEAYNNSLNVLSSVNTNSNPVYIGESDGYGYGAAGTLIDQVRFFNKALTQDDVDILYKERHPGNKVTSSYQQLTAGGRDYKAKLDFNKKGDKVSRILVAIDKEV